MTQSPPPTPPQSPPPPPPPPPPSYGPGQGLPPTDAALRTPGTAVASLILAIASFVLCFFWLASIPAVICGHIALSNIKSNPKTLGGEGIALGGLITGYINIVMAFFLIPIMAAIVLPALSSARQQAQSVQSLSQLHQMGIACITYTDNHDGTLPVTFEQLGEHMDAPYDPNSGVVPKWLLVPADDDQTTPSYEFVIKPVGTDDDGNPIGPNINKMKNPETVIFIRETKAFYGRRNALYCDLSVRGINPSLP